MAFLHIEQNTKKRFEYDKQNPEGFLHEAGEILSHPKITRA